MTDKSEKKQYRYNKEPEPYRLLKTNSNIYYPAHFQTQIEIVYCIKGGQDVLIDGLTYSVEEGDAVVIFPNQKHYFIPPEPKRDSQFYMLLFEPIYIEDFYREWNFFRPGNPVVKKNQVPENMPLLWDLFYETTHTEKDYRIFKAYTSLLVAHMIPALDLHPIDTDYAPEDVQIVLNYINQHFREDITLKSVAKAMGMHPNRLSALFNEKIGSGFSRHIKMLRIESARHLLKASNYSVNEIRALSGFQSNRTFFRCFQEEFGMTPLEYRELMDEKEKNKKKASN